MVNSMEEKEALPTSYFIDQLEDEIGEDKTWEMIKEMARAVQGPPVKGLERPTLTGDELLQAIHREKELKESNGKCLDNRGRPSKVEENVGKFIRCLEEDNSRETLPVHYFQSLKEIISEIRSTSRNTERKIRRKIEDELDIEFPSSFYKLNEVDILEIVENTVDPDFKEKYWRAREQEAHVTKASAENQLDEVAAK